MLAPPDFGPNDLSPPSRRHLLWLGLAVAAWSAFAVASPSAFRATRPAISGDLSIAGSRAMSGVVDRWVEIFRREHPEVRVNMILYGSGTAAGAMAEGRADVAPLVREMASNERSLVAAAQFDPRGIVVGYGPADRTGADEPLLIYVNRGIGAQPGRAAVEFVRVALSTEGQAALLAGRLPPARRSAAMRALAKLEADIS
ncbi:MAG: substrate-binding domain-containing protein [Sphingomonas sp.]